MSMNVEMARLLADMRQLREMAVRNDVLPERDRITSVGTAQPEAVAFTDVLGAAIHKVNDLQQESAALKTAFTHEEPGVDLTAVMVASQKASLATTAAIQVRNKFVQAYEEIMKMPI
ncbi:MAG: flagellar hook-basal body complex protein FliE [Gammaproteobacteria bacterium]